jgi:hypothetical protein
MATNYTGVDLDRYNAGNKFYSQDRYLQGTGLDKPAITFNPSNYDTGIMSQYPQYPIMEHLRIQVVVRVVLILVILIKKITCLK